MRKILQVMWVVFFSVIAVSAFSQGRTITGKVTAVEDGSSIPGVNVTIKGTTTGTVTDATGVYSINASADAVLVFSFIGLVSQEVQIGTRSVIDVSMVSDVTQLSEVVVTGYGSTLKKEFAGAVSSISAEDLGKVPVTSINQALQGQASGVFVFSNSGTPGGGISVRVRGQSSISASNDPLYVIDGVPVVAGDLTQSANGGQGQNALAGLNPQDIERIEVLKDASSTAIYGTRGANGVVMITTKRGKSGRPSINVSAWTGWANPVNTVEAVGAQEWVDIKNEARVNDGLAPLTNAQLGWDGTSDTDWIDEVFRTARVNEYQANVSGGDEKTTYYVSGSYRDEEGTIIGSGYERGTLRLNLDSKATEIFSFGTSLGISSDLNNRINNDNNIYGIYSAAVLTPSVKPVLDAEGNYADALPSFNTNAVRAALTTRRQNRTNKFIGNLYMDFKLMEGLNFRTDFSLDYNTITEDIYQPASTAQGRPNGTGSYNFRSVGTYIVEPTLRYTKQLSSGNLSAVLGGTIQSRTQFQNSVNGNNFAREDLTYLTSAATISGGSSFRSDYSLASLFGRVNYTYNEKYIASASVRRDGSSRFGPNFKYATFWAASLGWNFSDEAFMDNISWLSLGKIRASYGTTGNDGLPNFTYVGAWSGDANYLDQPATVPTQIANPDLKWEETATLDIGLELSLFDNRLEANFGYFNRKTSDLLYGKPLPQTTGFTSVQENIGEMENNGFEIDLTGVAINSPSGFKLSIGANATFQKNKIVSLIDNEPVLQGFASAILVGQPLSTFYGLKFEGVDPGTGESIFADVNGDGVVDTNDNTVIGDAFPDIYGGFTLNASYKGLTLDAFFQFVDGVDVYNNTAIFNQNPGAPWGMSTAMRRRWMQEGDITDVPKASNSPGFNTTDNSRWLSDGSYMRLKNVTLSYDLPTNLISKAKLRSVRVFATGTNLLTFTRYQGADPEVSVFANTTTSQGTDFLTFPQSKMISVGLNIGL